MGTNNQPGQGFIFEEVVPALIALQLYTNRDVTNFEIECNKDEKSKFDDVVVRIETKTRNLNFAIQLKHAEKDKKTQEEQKIYTDNFIKGKPTKVPSEFKGDFVLNLYARTSFCSDVRDCAASNCNTINCQDIHCSVSECKLLHRSEDRQRRIQSEYHFILYTNRRFVFDQKDKLKEFTMSKNNSDPGKSYFDTSSNSENNIYEFQTNSNTPETTDVKLDDYNLFFSNFSLYTSQKNAKEVETTIRQMFESVFKSDRCNDYITFFRHCHSNHYSDRKINKNIIRIQLINLLLKPQTLSIVDKDLDLLFEEILKNIEVTTINESYEDFVKDYCVKKYVNQKINVDDQSLYDIGRRLKMITSEEHLTEKKKQMVFWFHFKRPIIIDYGSRAEKQETVTETINRCRDINTISFVIVGRQVDTDIFPDRNSFHNLGNLVKQFPNLYEKLEPELKVHLRPEKSLPLKDLMSNNSHLYNSVTPADVIQMLKDNFYMEERRKDSQDEFYVPRKLSNVLISKASIRPSQDNMFVVSFQGFSFTFKKRFLQSLQFTCEVITSNRKLTEEEFNLICNVNPDINIHYLQVIDNNHLQWITTKGRIDHIRKHTVIEKFISEDKIFNYKKKINLIRGLSGYPKTNKIKLICGLAGLGKTKVLRRLKDICPLDVLTIFVHLPGHKNNFNKQHDATECLSSFLNVIDKNIFKQELLQIFKNQKKIIFFLDGFDELHNDEAEHAKEYIIQISQLGFQIWITARDICREDLEKTFNTISITIKPYSTRSEQEKYVEKELKFLKKNSIVPDVKKLIGDLNKKNKEILELPLHLSMIVQTYEKISIPNVQDFDVTSLYRHFINGKHQQFCIDQKLSKNLKISETIKRHYIEEYGKAALKTYFNQDLLDRLHVFYNTHYRAFLEEDKDPWGLFASLDGPTFIHQTYAVYFAALWISNNVKENDVTLLKEIFNYFVLKDCTMALQILLGKYTSLQEYVKSEDPNDKTPLHLAFKNGSYDTISFLEDKGANLKQLGDSLMQQLLSNGKTEMFKDLHEKGVEVNGFHNGLGLLHVAVILNKADMVRFLIRRKININQECSTSSEECRSITDEILGTGWEKYIEEGKTALDLAIDYKLAPVVKILLNNGAECNKYQKENALKQATEITEINSFIDLLDFIPRFIQMALSTMVVRRPLLFPRKRCVRPVKKYQHRLSNRYRRRANNRLQQMPKLTLKKNKK